MKMGFRRGRVFRVVEVIYSLPHRETAIERVSKGAVTFLAKESLTSAVERVEVRAVGPFAKSGDKLVCGHGEGEVGVVGREGDGREDWNSGGMRMFFSMAGQVVGTLGVKSWMMRK